jgi:anhydro-N-acetylmuramic acid kinase
MSELLTYRAIGLMSGTSLDGLDIAHCTFYCGSSWSFELHHAATIPYDEEWRKRLREAHTLSGRELAQLNVELGIQHGDWVAEFIECNEAKVDFIASHGHTVFHKPEAGLTLQIASPAHIAAKTGCDVIADFRTTDVALGGQGAPLVPIGDLLLFDSYPICLNLGGIANMSVKDGSGIKAFDIGLCNMALNHVAEQMGLSFDRDGAIAQEGQVHEDLLNELNALDFFHQSAPKSLGKEFWLTEFLPIVELAQLNERDLLCTLVEHISAQIGRSLTSYASCHVLATGGGAHNSFLIERIQAHTHHTLIVPEKGIVDFKEALIFAFLGALRLSGKSNSLSTVTGALRDSLGGAVYSAR